MGKGGFSRVGMGTIVILLQFVGVSPVSQGQNAAQKEKWDDF